MDIPIELDIYVTHCGNGRYDTVSLDEPIHVKIQATVYNEEIEYISPSLDDIIEDETIKELIMEKYYQELKEADL